MNFVSVVHIVCTSTIANQFNNINMCENSFYYVDPFDVSHLSPYNDPDYMEQYAELELSSAWCCDWYPNAKLDLELPF